MAVAPAMGAKVAPESVDTSHWVFGVGEPAAAAENVVFFPAATVTFEGSTVTGGARVTLRVAAVVLAPPAELVNRARYWSPFSPAFAVKE